MAGSQPETEESVVAPCGCRFEKVAHGRRVTLAIFPCPRGPECPTTVWLVTYAQEQGISVTEMDAR